MEIDLSRVLTDEHLEALERLSSGNLTNGEIDELEAKLPTFLLGLSREQSARVAELESEGHLEEALDEGVGSIFALRVAETTINGRINGRLGLLNSIPDQMGELEKIAQTEMGSEIAEIRRELTDIFPLPVREIVRLYKSLLSTTYERLEKEFNMQKKRYERKEALGISNSKSGYELTRAERLLAEICPLFRDATPEVQQDVWRTLQGATRNQWALFLIATDTKTKAYRSLTDAVKGIVKPNAKTLEEISGRTNMRGILLLEGSEQYRKDMEKISGIAKILKADAVLRKSRLLRP